MREEVLNLALPIGSRLVSELTCQIELRPSEHPVDVETIRSRCLDVLAQQNLQRDLRHILQPLESLLSQRILSDSAIVLDHYQEDPEGFGTAFWPEWVDTFAGSAETNSELLHFMPWSNLSDDDLVSIVAEVFNTFMNSEDEWLVVFKIRGLDSSEFTWSVSDITFYDPSVLNFGVHMSGSYGGDTPVSYARVLVRADTVWWAKEIGRQYLNSTLNALSFGLSARVRAGGFKPELAHENYDARNLSTGVGYFAYRRRRPELSSNRKAKPENELVKAADAYQNLLREATTRPDRLDELQSGFLKALQWYRKGRWDPEPAEQFLFYWIAVEHLFGSGWKVIETVSKIHNNWLDLGISKSIYYEWRQVIRLIEQDQELSALVEAVPQMQGWARNPTVLLRLDKVGQLIDLTPLSKVDARSYFRDFESDLRELSDDANEIDAILDISRDDGWFSLFCLYQYRNAMVHEALVYTPEIEHYADVLEYIVEDVLAKMAPYAVEPDPVCKSIDDLVCLYEPPWKW
jgi:hypothetical protein